MDYSNYSPYMQFDSQTEADTYGNNMFNPMLQYEQAYTYYKYLCMQMDYKIKCKEYENLCNKSQDSNKKVSASTTINK